MTEIEPVTGHTTRGRRDGHLRSIRRSLLAGSAAAIAFGLLLLAAPSHAQTTAKIRKDSTMTQLEQVTDTSPDRPARLLRPRTDFCGSARTRV